MAAGEEKLRLVLSAIDKTAAPLRAMNRRIEALTAPVRKVRNAFRSLAQEAHLDKLGAGIAKVAGWARNLAIAAVGAGAGFLAFVERTAEAADNLSEFTRLVGINVEDFQELQFAAKRAGIENETFAASMRALSINVGRAQAGTGKLAGLLKKVAPSVLKQVQGAKDTGAALEVVLSAMRRLPKEAQRNALATAAFGNAQLALLATLSPDELNGFREEARKLGIVLSSDAAAGAESLMDNFDDLKASTLGLARSIAVSLFPDLQRVTDRMLEWIKSHRDLILTKGREWVIKIAKGVEALANWLVEAVPQFADFVEHMGGLKVILGGMALLTLAPLAASIVSLAGAFGALGIASAPLLAVAAALGGIFYYRKELADFFGLSATPTNVPSTQPREIPGLVAPDVGHRSQVDVSGTIGIALSGEQRARVASSRTMNPALQFDLLSRGTALGPQ